MVISKLMEEIQNEAGIVSELIGPAFGMLLILMFVDYISGFLAAKSEAKKFPNDNKYGLSSKKGTIGIYKKMGYVVTIFVAICLDFLIGKYIKNFGVNYIDKTVFGLMVTLWFDVNEMISITENMGRMGVSLPRRITRVMAELKENLDGE